MSTRRDHDHPPRRAVKRVVALTAAALLAVLAPIDVRPAQAQDPEAGAILLIMDASGSMNAVDDRNTPLLDGAKAALNRVVQELPDRAVAGLRVFGHRTPNSDRAAGCQDTELVVPVAPLDRARMLGAIASYRASGFTPIGLSLQKGTTDLPPEGPRTIVLVTDGEDTCGTPDPCQVARDLSATGVAVRIETVGFYLGDNRVAEQQLQCIAAATGGGYRRADSADTLAEELSEISSRAVREFTSSGQPVEGAPAAVNAPVLAPGTYSDTILAQETHWYAVRLVEGQELTATVTRAGVTGFRSPLGSYMAVAFADPDLTEFGRQRTDTATDRAHTMRIRTGVVGREPAAGQPALQPGTYAVRVTVEDNPYLSFAGREVPLEVRLDVSNGTPAASAVPTSAASAAPTTDATAVEPRAGGGPPLLTIALGVLIVLVILLAAAVVVLLRRQRPPT
jgi:Ca-activated chloride channel family protein